MLDQLIGGLKTQLLDGIQTKTGLGTEKAEATIPLAKESISEGLMGAVSQGNISDVVGMFSGGGNMIENTLYQSIGGSFISKMVSQLGLPEGIAQKVSSFALPMIMKVIGKKASNDKGEIDQSGLLNVLGGGEGGIKGMAGDLLKNKAGDMLKGGLGKMFG